MLSAEKQRLVSVLEDRGSDPDFKSFRESYLDAMQLTEPAVVLDVGCGSGVVARSLAGRPWFNGSIVAIDLDLDLIEVAQELAVRDGVGDRIRFQLGDAQNLELDDASIDGVTAQTAISHVEDPSKALSEIARVTKAGGKVAISDGDYESRAFGCSDHELARAMEEAFQKFGSHQPRLIRDLPELLHSAGFDLMKAIPFVDANVGAGGKWLDSAERFGPRLAEAGYVTNDQVERWLKELRAANSRGTFFAASNYYAFIARRR